MSDPRRELPSVSALLESAAVGRLMAQAPRAVVVDAVRDAVARARKDPGTAPRGEDEWALAIGDALAARSRASLRPVFNATGVILHTNLGRAPLPRAAIEAIAATAAGYSNLEYDIEQGARGSRYTHCVSLLTELTGAEDAIVVNNCASALVLALNTVADGKATIVSRGELIEIGGSFRVPDIMAKSGSRLLEVGTTNRTHPSDYAAAITPETGALLKVHRSNFAIDGFVAEASLADLVPLGPPVLHDFGSGLMMSLDAYGLAGEPTARDSVRAGATLTMMSGDKLLGGPQAGIIVGSASVVAAARRNPLTRALRVDKLTLAALEATLALYRDPDTALRDIPTLAMLTVPVERIRERARLAALRVPGSQVTESEANVGGGAFPTARIASAAVALTGEAETIEQRLRRGEPAVIGRIADGRCLLDMRSVPQADDTAFIEAVLRALA